VDIWDFFLQREAECDRLSLTPMTPFEEMCIALEGSNDRRGRFIGRFLLTADAYLSVAERWTVVGHPGHMRREEYAYFLVVNGEEVWGYERDPTHSPAVHHHFGPDHPAGISCAPIPFRNAVEFAWEEVSRRAERGELELPA
jgi:hypothetical protein